MTLLRPRRIRSKPTVWPTQHALKPSSVLLRNRPPQTSSGAGGHGDLAHAMRRRTPKRTTRSAEEAEECAERERGAGERTPAARVEDEEAKEEHLFQPPSAEAPEPPPAETPEPPVDAFVDNKHEAEFMDDQCWAAREVPQLNEESDAEYDEDPAGSFKPLHARKVGETKVKMRVEGPVRQPEVGLPDGGLEPAEVLQIFFGPALQTLVVAQTNLYASQQKAKAAAGLASARSAAAAANAACPASPVNPREWKPINRISLMKYIAIIISRASRVWVRSQNTGATARWRTRRAWPTPGCRRSPSRASGAWSSSSSCGTCTSPTTRRRR